MNIWSIALIATGVVCIVVSYFNSKRSTSTHDLLAIHKSMDDEQIHSQLKQRRWRVDAILGVQFGSALIALGLLWHLLVYLFWF